MRIGDAADAAGVTPSAVRFYERRGLLAPPTRTSGGYRDYGPEVIGRLRFIKAGQRIGLTLAELREVIALREHGQAPCAHVLELMEERRQQIASQIDDLRMLQGELSTLVNRGRELDPADCDPGSVCGVVVPR